MPLYDDDPRSKKAARDDDSGRPSWRELDRRKDRSNHAPADREPAERAAPRGTKAAYLQKRASTAALSDAQALFSDPARDKAVAKLRDASDADAVQAVVDPFREQYGALPDDPAALIQALLHPAEEVQLEAIDLLGELLPELEGTTRETVVRGLSLFRMSARSMDARKAAKRVLKVNGVNVASF